MRSALSLRALGFTSFLIDMLRYHVAFNEGNAGAFITRVHIIKEANRAYVIFTNAATPATKEAVDVLLKELIQRYEGITIPMTYI